MAKQKPFKFHVGADPEFNITFQDRRVSAEVTIQQLMGSRKECKETNMGYSVKDYGSIGWDGHCATGEIRPEPSKSPKGLVKNIRELFTSMVKDTQIFDLSTLSKTGSAGGHLHFEIKPDLSDQRLKSLNRRMTLFYLPLSISENKENLLTRMKSNFGYLDDFKYEPKGKVNTYEMRSPSAEWLTTPKIAECTIAYLATVFHEIQNNPSTFKNMPLLYANQKQGRTLQELVLSEYALFHNKILSEVKKAIKSFEYYKHYKSEIDYILSPSKVMKDKQAAEYNIVLGWSLEGAKQPSKRELLSKRKLVQKSMLFNASKLMDLITIESSNDVNIDLAVRAIKQRIVNLGWKLKNKYFLFGLRSNIKEFIVANKNIHFLYGDKQIRTLADRNYIQALFERISTRFYIDSSGKSIEEKKNVNAKSLIIGIPYKMRAEEDFKGLIELIYNLEKNEDDIQPVDLNQIKVFKKGKDNVCPANHIQNVDETPDLIDNLRNSEGTRAFQEAQREIRESEDVCSNCDQDIEDCSCENDSYYRKEAICVE